MRFAKLVGLALFVALSLGFAGSNRADDPDSPSAGTRLVLTINGAEFAFRYCPPGTFTMGSPETEAERWESESERQTTLTRGFWIQETETTQAQWEALTGKNPSFFKGSNRPVEQISWDDCQGFVESLNAAKVAPEGATFALPTEAQWEYACRAGTTTPFPFGSILNGTHAHCTGGAPYGTKETGPCIDETRDVGSYPPNPWGIYDMCGNVYEWCADWYGDYPEGDLVDPTGPSEGRYRSERGGSWNGVAGACRSACRNRFKQAQGYNDLGVRIVLIQN